MRAYAYEFRKKIKENAEKLIKEIEEEEESNVVAAQRAYENKMDISDQYNSE